MFKKFFSLLILVGAVSASAGDKSFADTREFKKSETQKGYLLQKHEAYSKMKEEPKGTNCDWVAVDPSFDLADIRKEGLTMQVGAFAVTEGYFGGLFSNPIVQSFEQSLGTKGVRVSRASSTGAPAPRPMPNQAMAMAQIFRQNPQALEMMIDQRIAQDSVGTQMQLDQYNEDKKTMTLEEAAKRAEARKAERRGKIRAELLGENVPAPAAPAEATKPKAPEENPGYFLVFYVAEANENSGGFWSPVATNTTTAEFILFKDGRMVLAGRHNAASMGFGGGSGAKCGQALASALDIVVKKS